MRWRLQWKRERNQEGGTQSPELLSENGKENTYVRILFPSIFSLGFSCFSMGIDPLTALDCYEFEEVVDVVPMLAIFIVARFLYLNGEC